MNKQEILDAFILAEKHWSEPIIKRFTNHTNLGICHYFMFHRGYEKKIVDKYFMPYLDKYRTTSGVFLFVGYGFKLQGRQERLEAIQKVIIDLKNELNENN